MVVITVDGKAYDLNEQELKVMLFVQEALAIGDSDIKINNISQQVFHNIQEILKLLNYEIKEPPKISTNVLENYIGKPLAKRIGNLDPKKLNELYRAVHFLKITPLRKCIAAVLACWVFIEPNLDSYNKKKAELKLVKELTTEISREYKERFPFMN